MNGKIKVSVRCRLVTESMPASRVRANFSCLRSLIFLFFVNSVVVYGFEKESRRNNVEKLFVNSYSEGEKIDRPVLSSELISTTNKGKITNTEKLQRGDVKRQRNNDTESRTNAGLVDEDLFEFMVRIANTPVEWERIRRVLSRIKEEENENRTFVDFGKTFRELKKNERQESENKLRYQSSNNRGKSFATLSRQANPQLTKKIIYNSSGDIKPWPTGEWILNFMANRSRESYKYADNEVINDYDDDDDEDADNLADLETNADVEDSSIGNISKITRWNNRSDAFEESSRLIIPNSDLPKFAYRRVLPDLRNKESSAYIAVSVVSAGQNATSNDAKIENSVDQNDRIIYEAENKYSNLEKLETRRRHSRRKHHKI